LYIPKKKEGGESLQLSTRKTITLTTVLFVAFIDYLGIGLVYPLFASLLFDHEVQILNPATSDTIRGLLLGVLIALVPLVQFFSAPILGALSDIKGRKKILTVSLSLAILGYCVAFFGIIYSSLFALFLYRIIIGVSAGSAAVVQAILADTSVKSEKTKNFGLYNMALGAGFTIGPFIGGKLTDPNFIKGAGFNFPFGFALLLTATNLVFVLLFFKETNYINDSVKVTLTTGLRNLKKALYMKKVRVVILCAFILYFGWSFFYEFVPVFLIGQYSFKSHQIGNFYAYSGFIYALCSGWLIRPIIQRFSSYRIFLGSLFGAGLTMLLFSLIKGSTLLFFYAPFLLYFIALIFPTIMTLVSNFAPKKAQGETLGVLQSVQASAFALSPLFSGSLIGFYRVMPVIIGGISMLLSAIIFSIFMYRNYIEEKQQDDNLLW
jgi:DHA1 family tetracycline resistance protein-like MFS transporter